MEALKTTQNATYRVVADEIEGLPGRLGKSHVRIFLVKDTQKIQIGEYVRNYPSFGLETFLPFSRNDRDYALFSPDYTCTRVMELPSCTDIGGEEPSSGGFCPVEYCVPQIVISDAEKRESEIGFVAGCTWGDDSSWKVECFDLSEVQRGIIKRDARFGYLELPDGVSLEKAIVDLKETMSGSSSAVRLRIACLNAFDIRTGKPTAYDPFE